MKWYKWHHLVVVVIALSLIPGCIMPDGTPVASSDNDTRLPSPQLTPTPPTYTTGYYDGPIVDNHVHPIPPWVGDQNEYYDGLIIRMDDGGVSKIALHRNADWTLGYTSFSSEHDEWVLAAFNRYPDRIIPYLGGFDPSDPAAIDYVREQLQTGKWNGIGELDLRNRNSKTQIPVNSPIMMEIHKLASEFSVPVIIHYEADYGVQPTEAEQELEEALEKNPETIIIFAHHPPVHLMRKHQNLWAEVSLFIPNDVKVLMSIYESEVALLDRIVLCVADIQTPNFVQQIPFRDRDYTYEELIDLARWELGKLPRDVAEKIAYKNLCRLLGIMVSPITVPPSPAPTPAKP